MENRCEAWQAWRRWRHRVICRDQITEAAFKEQERRLQEMIGTHSAQEFRERLISRLGQGQASVLMNHYYPGNF